MIRTTVIISLHNRERKPISNYAMVYRLPAEQTVRYAIQNVEKYLGTQLPKDYDPKSVAQCKRYQRLVTSDNKLGQQVIVTIDFLQTTDISGEKQ